MGRLRNQAKPQDAVIEARRHVLLWYALRMVCYGGT